MDLVVNPVSMNDANYAVQGVVVLFFFVFFSMCLHTRCLLPTVSAQVLYVGAVSPFQPDPIADKQIAFTHG